MVTFRDEHQHPLIHDQGEPAADRRSLLREGRVRVSERTAQVFVVGGHVTRLTQRACSLQTGALRLQSSHQPVRPCQHESHAGHEVRTS